MKPAAECDYLAGLGGTANRSPSPLRRREGTPAEGCWRYRRRRRIRFTDSVQSAPIDVSARLKTARMTEHVSPRRPGTSLPARPALIALAQPTSIQSQPSHRDERVVFRCPNRDPLPRPRAAVVTEPFRRHRRFQQSGLDQDVGYCPGAIVAAILNSRMPTAVPVWHKLQAVSGLDRPVDYPRRLPWRIGSPPLAQNHQTTIRGLIHILPWRPRRTAVEQHQGTNQRYPKLSARHSAHATCPLG